MGGVHPAVLEAKQSVFAVCCAGEKDSEAPFKPVRGRRALASEEEEVDSSQLAQSSFQHQPYQHHVRQLKEMVDEFQGDMELAKLAQFKQPNLYCPDLDDITEEAGDLHGDDDAFDEDFPSMHLDWQTDTWSSRSPGVKIPIDGMGAREPALGDFTPRCPRGPDATVFNTPLNTPRPHSRRSSVPTDFVIRSLEKAEELVYGQVFARWDLDGNGRVPVESAVLRDFVLANTVVSPEDLDDLLHAGATLRTKLQARRSLNLQDFLHLIRENIIHKSDAVEQFRGPSGGRSEARGGMTHEECRTELRAFTARYIGESVLDGFNESQQEHMFSPAEHSPAPEAVSLDAWVAHCRRVARIIRLVHYREMCKPK